MRSDPRQQADAGAQLLTLGATLSAVARTCLPVGLIGLLINQAGCAGLLSAMLLLAWASGEWFGARVRLNRRLFKRVAHATFQLESLDYLLGRASRPVGERIKGALRLLRIQGWCTAACVLMTTVLLLHAAV